MRVFLFLISAITVLTLLISATPVEIPGYQEVLKDGEVVLIAPEDNDRAFTHYILSFSFTDETGTMLLDQKLTVQGGTTARVSSQQVVGQLAAAPGPLEAPADQAIPGKVNGGWMPPANDYSQPINERRSYMYIEAPGERSPLYTPITPPEEYLDACRYFELNGLRLWVYFPEATELELSVRRSSTTWRLEEREGQELPELIVTNSPEVHLGTLEYELR